MNIYTHIIHAWYVWYVWHMYILHLHILSSTSSTENPLVLIDILVMAFLPDEFISWASIVYIYLKLFRLPDASRFCLAKCHIRETNHRVCYGAAYIFPTDLASNNLMVGATHLNMLYRYIAPTSQLQRLHKGSDIPREYIISGDVSLL